MPKHCKINIVAPIKLNAQTLHFKFDSLKCYNGSVYAAFKSEDLLTTLQKSGWRKCKHI